MSVRQLFLLLLDFAEQNNNCCVPSIHREMNERCDLEPIHLFSSLQIWNALDTSIYYTGALLVIGGVSLDLKFIVEIKLEIIIAMWRDDLSPFELKLIIFSIINEI